MGEVMENYTHHKLVEQDDSDKASPGNDCSDGLISLSFLGIWILF